VAKVNSCLTFELDFDSDMTTHVDDGGYTYHLQAQDVLFGPGVADPGALSWVEFTGGQAGSGVCGSSHETYNYTWDAEGHADSTIKPELLADINPRLPGAASADPLAGAMVAVFTDAPKERYRYTADGCSVTDDLVENEIWEAIFSLSDPDVSKIGGSDVGVGALTLYRNPEHGTPGSALLLVAQSTSDSPELQEDTSLQVWHRPQPLP
jgi:hypothetical protein